MGAGYGVDVAGGHGERKGLRCGGNFANDVVSRCARIAEVGDKDVVVGIYEDIKRAVERSADCGGAIESVTKSRRCGWNRAGRASIEIDMSRDCRSSYADRGCGASRDHADGVVAAVGDKHVSVAIEGAAIGEVQISGRGESAVAAVREVLLSLHAGDRIDIADGFPGRRSDDNLADDGVVRIRHV